MTKPIYRREAAISEKVREGIGLGISLTKIHESCRKYDSCPQSLATFIKIYDPVISEARYEFDKWITNKLKAKVEEGDSRLIEFTLRSKSGWNPSLVIEDGTDKPDENRDAVSVLVDLIESRNKPKTPKE